MSREQAYAYLGVAFSVIVWGASFIATKFALRDVSPVTVVWTRFAMGVVILGIAVFVRRQFACPVLKDLGYFAFLGFLGITFHQWLQSTALLTSQASTTAWIVATTPVFIALLGWLVLKERLGRWRVFGIGLAAFGVLLVVTNGDLLGLLGSGFGQPGDILILISSVNWAVFTALSRRGLQSYSATLMMFYVMGFGWLFTSLLLFAGPGLGEIAALTPAGWTGVVFLGLFCSGLAYIFWYSALRALPAAQVGAFLYLEPLVAVVVAAILLGEAISLASGLGGGIILLGVWLVNRPQR